VNLQSRLQQQAVNRVLGMGLAVLIAVYFFAAICFIILE
jgi:hypothetical protein